jgi:signal transduction histidine kinase
MHSYLHWVKLVFICTVLAFLPLYYSISSPSLAGYFFTAGLFLGIYFSLPLWKVSWGAYFLAGCIIASMQIFVLDPIDLVPWIFSYFLLVEGMQTLTRRKRIVNMLAVLIPMSVTAYQLGLGDAFFFHIMLSCLFIGIGWLLQTYYSDTDKKEKEWKSLLLEYRQLKRQVIENEEVARVEERNRIARDIHDTVGHQLTALMMQLAIAEQSTKGTELNGILSQSKQLARESLEGMRKAVKALQGEEEKGIASVLHLIRKLEAESQMRIQLTTKTGVLSVPLSNEQNIAIYRFVQEGLTNAMRHGSSREIAVTLEIIGEHSLQAAVTNKIAEFSIFEEGFGMINMRKRFEALSGRLDRVMTDTHFTIKGIFPLREDT